jgi:spore germination cell wall hydrolase CwlJ-like protein
MRISHLVLLLGIVTGGVAQAQNSATVRADYRAVPSLRHHLPINIPEAQGLGEAALRDLECLSWNLYFEARGGVRSEQIAVAWVPINRLNHPAFSNDICTNVFQYGWAGGRRQYQFSWAGIVRGPRWRREDEAWTRMQRIALQVYQRELPDPARGAIYFHHANLVPGWAPRASKIRLGSHVFWRM